MHIAFRVDPSVLIGSGHVARCLTLADTLRDSGAECHFVCRQQRWDMLDFVQWRGYRAAALSVGNDGYRPVAEPRHAAWLGVDWTTDVDETFQSLSPQRVDMLVVDHNALNYQWERALRAYQHQIMVIDDLADRSHDGDLLPDQSFGCTENDYADLRDRSTSVLLGPKYSLLQPLFLAARGRDSGDTVRLVLASADEGGIAEVAPETGGEVPCLRDAAADDQTPSSVATLVALRQAEAHWDEHYDTVAQLMANCPLRSARDIREAMTAFETGAAPAQISAFRFGWMNPWWAARLQADGQPDWLFPEARSALSLDLPLIYCSSGALWLAERDGFLGGGSFYLPGHALHPVDWISVMDIDDDADLAMAEVCMELYLRAEGAV